MIIADVADYRREASRRLPRFLYDYLEGGALGEVTLAANRSDLGRLMLRQRVARDVSEINLTADFLGQQLTIPLVLAPVGLAGFMSRRGEVQAARAAREYGVPFTLSSVSACPVEEVRQGAGSSSWFQLYVTRDRGFMRSLLARAKANGCQTLVLTVDLAVPGIRYRDVRSGLSGSGGLRGLKRALQTLSTPQWLWDVGVRGRPLTIGHLAEVVEGGAIENFWSWISANFDPSISWSDIAHIREAWSGQLIVKGILEPQDALEALAAGADAIWVSNHGGRQLDGARSSASALPEIRRAVGNDCPIVVDGGVRSGTDVIRMIALGANLVALGRSWVYGLATDGSRGVSAVLAILERELRMSMALTGCRDIVGVTASILTEPL